MTGQDAISAVCHRGICGALLYDKDSGTMEAELVYIHEGKEYLLHIKGFNDIIALHEAWAIAVDNLFAVIEERQL